MTDQEFQDGVAKGNFKQVGALEGAGQHGTKLRVLCVDWDPVPGDIFSVRGIVSQVWANGREIDASFTVVRVQEPGTIDIHPPIIPGGQYKNVSRLAGDGAILYQPAGELLKAIWHQHLESAR